MVLITAFAIALAIRQSGSPVNDLPAKYHTKPPAAATVVARVNGVEITAGEVESLLWEWRGSDAIQDLITYQVVKSEAEKQRIDVAEKDIEGTIDGFIRQYQGTLKPGENAWAALAAQGLTRSRLYLRFKSQMYIQKILEREFVPDKLVKISTIIIRPASAQTADHSVAIKKADDAYDRLQKGEKWDAIFDAFNMEPGIKGSKGLIGWRFLAAFPDSVATELKGLKPGGVTKPAETVNGIQIFRMELAGKDAKGKEYDEMKQAYMQPGQAQLLERLHNESKIERLYPPPPAP